MYIEIHMCQIILTVMVFNRLNIFSFPFNVLEVMPVEVGIDVADGEGSSSSTVISLPIYGLYKLCNFFGAIIASRLFDVL